MSEPTDPVARFEALDSKAVAKKAVAGRHAHELKRLKGAKESIHAVFEMLGGPIAYFHWAQKNQDKFYDHFIRTLPLEAKLDVAVKSDYTDVLEAARKRIRADERVAEDISDAEIIAECNITKEDKSDGQ